ncbi:apolipoprotein N-acyltransferase [Erythrobacter arachoides]|uniref:Apolipoprotein N-acyltransferase n=1 Tax=Aurantiacibacter arachoides TaxID=1850444 RepID=A0A845A3H6_9SPHN|nr:apolipoprotein N-acyltransferase [Aurantiacibacter arachoides]MXO94478.1 apolipoprotein N-acyltransferase [Aurantiacibacter arachoides]GGD63148.1 apolipoprotein N-acyltransferase [Aurantiacibacter arachoides]
MEAQSALPLIDRLPRADGRGAWLWALGLGFISATGFQPLGLWPLALLAMGLFALMTASASSWKRATWLGWLFGWAHFTFGNVWIADSFTHQAQMPAVLGWAAVPLLAIYLAVYPALAAGAARALARTGAGWGFVLVFAGAWVIAEWLRSWVFTGYAWNPFAMVLLGEFSRPGLAALAPMAGTYALSGFALFLSAAPLLLALERRNRVMLLVIALTVLGMVWPAPAPREGTVRVTIAKPVIAQAALNDPRSFEANYQRLADLSRRPDPAATTPRLVLWPESGMADYLREGYPQRYYDTTTAMGSPQFARRRLGATVGVGSVLLTGATELEIGLGDEGTRRAVGARNVVTALGANGDIIDSVAKSHLVPYGEYLPMRGLLEPLGLSRLVAGTIDYWPGPGARTVDLGPLGKVSPQICYEIIFSGQVVDRADRPDFIVNPSSEGWFGPSGPPQFMAQARMRAIEEGLPVLRATNNGISAVIDARGVVREHLERAEEGQIDAIIPPAAAPTPFARLGNLLSLFWAAGFLFAGVVAMRRQPR